MPPEGFANPVTSDGARFRSNIPVSELIKRVTVAIEASDVALSPLVAKTMDGVMRETQPTPIRPQGARGLEPPDPRSGDRGSKACP